MGMGSWGEGERGVCKGDIVERKRQFNPVIDCDIRQPASIHRDS
jgi:hypothetical protein